MSKNHFLKDAKENLEIAQAGINKPAYDIVTFSVCQHAQVALQNYMLRFIELNGGYSIEEETMKELYEKCLALDKDFAQFDIPNLPCYNEHLASGNCSSIKTIEDCVNIADKMDDLIK